MTLILFIAFVFTQGCSVRQRILRKQGFNDNGKEIYFPDTIGKNNLSDKNFIISKAVIYYEDSNGRKKFNAIIKHKAPDSLLLTLKSTLGIEVARILLTEDTILIKDRINKEIASGGTGKFKYGIDPALIYIMLGDYVSDSTTLINRSLCRKGNLRLVSLAKGREVQYTIDCSMKKVVNALIVEDIRNGNVNVEINKFSNINGFLMPKLIKITLTNYGIRLKISVEKFSLNWNGKIMFHVESPKKVIPLK